MSSLKRLLTRLVHFFRISLSLVPLILKFVVSVVKFCFGVSSKNVNLVVSISHILVAAFCFANFFCGAGYPIQENVISFFNFTSCLKRQQFLMFSKGLYNIRGFREIIFYAYFV